MTPTPEQLTAIEALLWGGFDTQARFVLVDAGWLTSEALTFLRQHVASKPNTGETT